MEFFPKKRHSEIFGLQIFSRPPKLGARSPPSGVPSTSAARGANLKCRPFLNNFLGSAEKNFNQVATVSDDLF